MVCALLLSQQDRTERTNVLNCKQWHKQPGNQYQSAYLHLPKFTGRSMAFESAASAIERITSGDAWLTPQADASEWSTFHDSLAQYTDDNLVDHTDGDIVDDQDALPALGKSLWQQMLEEAGDMQDEEQRGDAIDRHADEMEVSSADFMGGINCIG